LAARRAWRTPGRTADAAKSAHRKLLKTRHLLESEVQDRDAPAKDSINSFEYIAEVARDKIAHNQSWSAEPSKNTEISGLKLEYPDICVNRIFSAFRLD
jgi:hypothetical protein